MRFSDEFVLQGHGVSPSGRVVWPCLCAAEAAAVVLQSFSGMGNTRSSSSSSRPSVAWCFARAAGGTAAAAAAAAAVVAAAAAAANFLQRFSILFLGFQKQR